jgi:hypothetical protein
VIPSLTLRVMIGQSFLELSLKLTHYPIFSDPHKPEDLMSSRTGSFRPFAFPLLDDPGLRVT